MRRKVSALFMVIIMLVASLCNCFTASAATVSKNVKTYEIAVVFDNSGSMYDNQAWCRAKYAMEIFSSMLHYDNGDVLKIFPMWPVTTDGSKPSSGGSFSGIEIRGGSDINKISNLYTVAPSNTPFAPILEANEALQASSAKEKWLVVLTDGAFNQVNRNDNTRQMSSDDLRKRLLNISSTGIKVQYLGFGGATLLKSEEGQNFYAMKSTDQSLKDDLISICNTIFQRSVLPNKYISGKTINLDMSMKSVIVFAQGADAKITGLKSESGESIGIKLDSGQRKFSNISAGGKYSNAPVDNTLAGQVVTFDACPKGKYELIYSGADAIEYFYEPDVDIKMTLTNDDGEEVDYTQGNIASGDYTVNYSIVDAVTGEDVTKAELMGNDVSLRSRVRTSDGTETPFENGEKITLKPDDSTKVIVEGTYLKDYTISTEDDPLAFPDLKIDFPEIQKFEVELTTEQSSSWYQIGKEGKWKPIRANLTIAGVPLTDEQLSRTKLDLNFSNNIEYTVKPINGESAFEIIVGYGEDGKYKEPTCGSYKVDATATYTDEFGQDTSDSDSMGFDVQKYSAVWRWLFWLLLLLLLLLLIIFILTRKAWPKEMYFYCPKGSGKINVGKNMNAVSNIYPNVLSCTAEKSSTLMKKFGRQACVKITKVDPAFNVKSFKIGSSSTFIKDGGKFLDSKGKEFKEAYLRHNTKIEVEFSQKNKPPIAGKVCMNSKK